MTKRNLFWEEGTERGPTIPMYSVKRLPERSLLLKEPQGKGGGRRGPRCRGDEPPRTSPGVYEQKESSNVGDLSLHGGTDESKLGSPTPL